MELDRRGFIRLTATGAAAVLLDACTPAAPGAKPTAALVGSTPAGGPLPTYMAPSGGPKPDFHSADPRITDGFNNFPKDPVKSWSGGPPGSGGTLNVFMAGYYPAPTPRDSNATWKEVEKALNSTVNMTITPNADYSTRLQVVMAGNDLPDTIHVVGTVAPLISAQFVQAQCSDLTPYLAGDAAKDYPNLAAIPGYAYKGAGGVFDNRLYGIPIHRYTPASATPTSGTKKSAWTWSPRTRRISRKSSSSSTGRRKAAGRSATWVLLDRTCGASFHSWKCSAHPTCGRWTRAASSFVTEKRSSTRPRSAT
jgi:putative aldouronate transport system substrate-binding protein